MPVPSLVALSVHGARGASGGTLRSVGRPLYFSHSACLEHETGEHPERPARIEAIEAELERRGWLGYERREAPAAPLDAVTAVHAEG